MASILQSCPLRVDSGVQEWVNCCRITQSFWGVSATQLNGWKLKPQNVPKSIVQKLENLKRLFFTSLAHYYHSSSKMSSNCLSNWLDLKRLQNLNVFSKSRIFFCNPHQYKKKFLVGFGNVKKIWVESSTAKEALSVMY